MEGVSGGLRGCYVGLRQKITRTGNSELFEKSTEKEGIRHVETERIGSSVRISSKSDKNR